MTSPFDPAWEELEREALGRVPVPGKPDAGACSGAITENLARLSAPIGQRVAAAARALSAGIRATDEVLRVYRGAALYVLFEMYGARLQAIAVGDEVAVPFWHDFDASCRAFLGHPGIDAPEPARLLELFYQGRRAWHFGSTMILGGSPSAGAARLDLWGASMTRNLCLYAGGLYRRTDEIPVLITGETGTGKELAATVLARSRFISFDAGTRCFTRRCSEDFLATNLSEGPPDLVASKLFGHKRGAFTGAIADAQGLFGLTRAYAALFLDEVGELPLSVQAQLLRPLQNREYVAVGDTVLHPIRGRLLFGTHRDLEAMCEAGSFRWDLLERMNGFRVRLPPLRQMLAESPGELSTYVRAFIASMGTPLLQVDEETKRVVSVFEETRAGYAWRRNLRELYHETLRCLTGNQRPAALGASPAVPAAPDRDAPVSTCPPSSGVSSVLGWKAKAGEVSCEQVLRTHVTWIYFITNENASETARLTGLDRRTVMKKVDDALLARWKKSGK